MRPLMSEDSVFMVLLFITIIITIGEPDILDGLIKMVNK